jgi:glycosyltransferase involved in cell wall biosynthesis
MKIAFVYVGGRLARLADTRAGQAAREFFYGALELEECGHEVSLHEVDIGPDAPTGSVLVETLYKLHLTPSKTNAPLVRQLRTLLPELNSCNVVVATASGPAYGLALLTACGQLRIPLIAIHCGIANHTLRRRRRMINGLLLRRSWTMLYGDGEVEQIQQMFDVPADRLRVNQFGVDTSFWQPNWAKGDNYILAVGNDLRRDYALLLQLAQRIDERFIVVTRQNLGELPPNVEQVHGDWHAQALSDAGLRKLYQEAMLVVTPLKDSVQPSGQSVCLQAMACGKPVVLTRTRGLWSQEMMRDGHNVLLVSPEDLNALHKIVSRLISSPEDRERLGENARQTVSEHAEISLFASRLETLAEQIAR